MIVFEVKNSLGEVKKFGFEESLKEITLRRFIDFKENVEVAKPESLLLYEQAQTKSDKSKILKSYSLDEITDPWNDYTIAFVKFWTGITDDIIAGMKLEDVVYLYAIINNYFDRIDLKEDKLFFEFKGEKYYYPTSLVNPFSKQKDYMKGSTMVDVIETMQFELFFNAVGTSRWSILPNVVAILCKKENERLPIQSGERETWIAQRAKLMEELPVSDALDVAFFLLKRKNISERDLNKYSTLAPVQAFPIPEPLIFGKNTGGTQQSSKWLSQGSLIIVK